MGRQGLLLCATILCFYTELALAAHGYQNTGTGFCRSAMDPHRYLNCISKDGSSLNECKGRCDASPYCSGYAFSSSLHNGRCYCYGNTHIMSGLVESNEKVHNSNWVKMAGIMEDIGSSLGSPYDTSCQKKLYPVCQLNTPPATTCMCGRLLCQPHQLCVSADNVQENHPGYTNVGAGYCRSALHPNEYLNSISKDATSSNECKSKCDASHFCTGFAFCPSQYGGRCYNYGAVHIMDGLVETPAGQNHNNWVKLSGHAEDISAGSSLPPDATCFKKQYPDCSVDSTVTCFCGQTLKQPGQICQGPNNVIDPPANTDGYDNVGVGYCRSALKPNEYFNSISKDNSSHNECKAKCDSSLFCTGFAFCPSQYNGRCYNYGQPALMNGLVETPASQQHNNWVKLSGAAEDISAGSLQPPDATCWKKQYPDCSVNDSVTCFCGQLLKQPGQICQGPNNVVDPPAVDNCPTDGVTPASGECKCSNTANCSAGQYCFKWSTAAIAGNYNECVPEPACGTSKATKPCWCEHNRCNIGQTCQAGGICDDGVVSCTTDGLTPTDGSCTCDGVVCSAGFYCYPWSAPARLSGKNECVPEPNCSGTGVISSPCWCDVNRCTSGQRCIDNKCETICTPKAVVSAPCTCMKGSRSNPCEIGEKCQADGRCVPSGPGACEENRITQADCSCGSNTCTAGSMCQGGRCVEPNICEEGPMLVSDCICSSAVCVAGHWCYGESCNDTPPSCWGPGKIMDECMCDGNRCPAGKYCYSYSGSKKCNEKPKVCVEDTHIPHAEDCSCGGTPNNEKASEFCAAGWYCYDGQCKEFPKPPPCQFGKVVNDCICAFSGNEICPAGKYCHHDGECEPFPEDCTEHDFQRLSQECMCHGTKCPWGQWCYDGACHDKPKPTHPACKNSKKITKTCICAGNRECPSGHYCYDGDCHTNPKQCPAKAFEESPITEECMCGGKMCASGKYCVNGKCQDHPKLDMCHTDNVDALTSNKECNCYGNKCRKGKYCYQGECNNDPLVCEENAWDRVPEKCMCMDREGEGHVCTGYCFQYACEDKPRVPCTPNHPGYGMIVTDGWPMNYQKDGQYFGFDDAAASEFFETTGYSRQEFVVRNSRGYRGTIEVFKHSENCGFCGRWDPFSFTEEGDWEEGDAICHNDDEGEEENPKPHSLEDCADSLQVTSGHPGNYLLPGKYFGFDNDCMDRFYGNDNWHYQTIEVKDPHGKIGYIRVFKDNEECKMSCGRWEPDDLAVPGDWSLNDLIVHAHERPTVDLEQCEEQLQVTSPYSSGKYACVENECVERFLGLESGARFPTNFEIKDEDGKEGKVRILKDSSYCKCTCIRWDPKSKTHTGDWDAGELIYHANPADYSNCDTELVVIDNGPGGYSSNGKRFGVDPKCLEIFYGDYTGHSLTCDVEVTQDGRVITDLDRIRVWPEENTCDSCGRREPRGSVAANDWEVGMIIRRTCSETNKATHACYCGESKCSKGDYCADGECTVNCAESSRNPLSRDCSCRGQMCPAGNYCYSGRCHDDEALNNCSPSETREISSKCSCSGETCDVGRYCYHGECHDDPYVEDCSQHPRREISRTCNCAGRDCPRGKYCYDNGCHNDPKLDECDESDNRRISQTCSCSGTECPSGKYCYDGGCHDDPKMDDCREHDTREISNTCMCSGSECSFGKYCYDGGCHNEPKLLDCIEDDTTQIFKKCMCEDGPCDAGKYCYDGMCQDEPAGRECVPIEKPADVLNIWPVSESSRTRDAYPATSSVDSRGDGWHFAFIRHDAEIYFKKSPNWKYGGTYDFITSCGEELTLKIFRKGTSCTTDGVAIDCGKRDTDPGVGDWDIEDQYSRAGGSRWIALKNPPSAEAGVAASSDSGFMNDTVLKAAFLMLCLAAGYYFGSKQDKKITQYEEMLNKPEEKAVEMTYQTI